MEYFILRLFGLVALFSSLGMVIAIAVAATIHREYKIVKRKLEKMKKETTREDYSKKEVIE